MCKKIFALQRCLAPAAGGCDQYYAEYVADEQCNGTMHGGLPRPGPCPVVWAGFESEVSTKATRHTWFGRHRKGPCPACLHAADVRHLRAEAETERLGEFSERVKSLIQAEKDRANATEGAFMGRVYNEVWEVAHNLAEGLTNQTDAVWNGIEASMFKNFGAQCLARPDVVGFVYGLSDARRKMVVHAKTLSRELATVLVGSNAQEWDDIPETTGDDVRTKVNASLRANMALTPTSSPNLNMEHLSINPNPDLHATLEAEMKAQRERDQREQAFAAANRRRGTKRGAGCAELDEELDDLNL